MLNPSTWAYSLMLFQSFIFSFLNDAPQIIRKIIYSVKEFLLCLVVFPKVWEFIRELVEALYELADLLLFPICSLQEFYESPLDIIKTVKDQFSLSPDCLEDLERVYVVRMLKSCPNIFLLALRKGNYLLFWIVEWLFSLGLRALLIRFALFRFKKNYALLLVLVFKNLDWLFLLSLLLSLSLVSRIILLNFNLRAR